jgi:hypothetical protein
MYERGPQGFSLTDFGLAVSYSTFRPEEKVSRFYRNAGIVYLPNYMTSRYRIAADMRTSGGRRREV